MRTILSFILFFSFYSQSILAQRTGTVLGTVKDRNTQTPLIGASILVEGTQLGAITGQEGTFRIENIPTGSYNIRASFLGYKAETRFNVNLTSGNSPTLSFELTEETVSLNEVRIEAQSATSTTVADLITPLSVQSLSTEEIRSNPGGNFDISRVIQVLPGVTGTGGTAGSFRNDIIIRGGAPNENVYYLDDIEIPVINHFSTQGSAGGPTGILNVSFIEDVKLSASAFDARYDNALASVFQFKQRDGNPDRFQGNLRLSATELAATAEGPLGSKTSYLVSARRSYLQFLFEIIDLPIRPNYWDFQYKITHKIDDKTTLTALGVGAIDEFSFAIPEESTPENIYTLSSNPSINQWSYTLGFSLKRLIKDGFMTVALSRNQFDNQLDRFEDNLEATESERILGSNSNETENKLRINFNKYIAGWKFSYGLVGQYVQYNNTLYNRIRKEVTDTLGNLLQPQILVEFDTEIDFFRYGIFGQVSRSFFGDRLGLALGLRSDMNSFTDEGNNPIKTFSPRLSASYAIINKLKLNGSVGTYYKLPIYTVLGFRDSKGTLVNKDNQYIRTTHYVTGLEYLPKSDLRITLEGFYKRYANYPVSVREGISLANQGGDFGAIGNEETSSTGKGNTYGLELYVQQKLTGSVYAVFSYTFFRSKFSGANEELISSAWDNQNLISALLGKKFKKGWELGFKYRYAGGAPYTPFDLDASRLNYATLGVGILDYNQLNNDRLGAFNQLDLRIDKKWNFKRSTLDLFLDVTNVLGNFNQAYPQYTFERKDDNSDFKTTDGLPLRTNGSNAIPFIINNGDSNTLPTIGFIIEF